MLLLSLFSIRWKKLYLFTFIRNRRETEEKQKRNRRETKWKTSGTVVGLEQVA